MKPSIIIILFSTVLFVNSYGQIKDASQNLKQQANKMGVAFVSGDYKTFANYTYPLILKSMGGASKMIEVLNKTSIDMKLKGMSFSNITFDEPSKIVKSGKELQATITQHTEIKLSQGKLISTSTLIAMSTDNGIGWAFIDTSNKDMATLRKALPNLSPSIIIPPQQPPVRYNM
ncbi:MAG: hypothetical protein HYZ15_03945 [Sphingobacteriales bacterium]|nr:hypothetical protein [Sphingobacteriales bacterium]